MPVNGLAITIADYLLVRSKSRGFRDGSSFAQRPSALRRIAARSFGGHRLLKRIPPLRLLIQQTVRVTQLACRRSAAYVPDDAPQVHR
jgi:hypothetical protein